MKILTQIIFDSAEEAGVFFTRAARAPSLPDLADAVGQLAGAISDGEPLNPAAAWPTPEKNFKPASPPAPADGGDIVSTTAPRRGRKPGPKKTAVDVGDPVGRAPDFFIPSDAASGEVVETDYQAVYDALFTWSKTVTRADFISLMDQFGVTNVEGLKHKPEAYTAILAKIKPAAPAAEGE